MSPQFLTSLALLGISRIGRPSFLLTIAALTTLITTLLFTLPEEQLAPVRSAFNAAWGSSTKVGSFALSGGLLEITVPTDQAHIVMTRHPILQLVDEARVRKDQIEFKKSQVDSLDAAVEDYRAAFGLDPPEGFDEWYKFATSVNAVRTPSLIPEAHLSVLPYLALPPHLLRSRAVELQDETAIFGMTFYPNGLAEGQEREDEEMVADGLIGIRNTDFVVGYMSPRDYPELLQPIVSLLPLSQQPNIPLQLTLCVRDQACRLTSGLIMEVARKLAREGSTFQESDLLGLEANQVNDRGWKGTCPFSTLVEGVHSNTHTTKSFIANHNIAMDFCIHPELINENGEMIMESEHLLRPLAPMLAVSRPLHGADMLGTPTRAVKDTVDHAAEWESKTHRQIAWRGTLTGIYHRDRWDWRSSQRHRLSHLAGNSTDGMLSVLVERPDDETVVMEKWSEKDMVERWMNVGLIKEDIHNLCGPGPTDDACRTDGGPQYAVCEHYEPSCAQMQEEYQWRSRMSLEDTLLYRYQMDVDGYGWSSRWRKLLSTNSVVLKSTLYPEWWTAQAIPWYHYVPLQYDYSDLWDIMSFLDGAPDGSSPGREDIARGIAQHGKEFANHELRWEEMQSYMFLFLLEYRRAWSDDRVAATYMV